MHQAVHAEDPSSSSTLGKYVAAISHWVFCPPPRAPPLHHHLSLKAEMGDVFGIKGATLSHRRAAGLKQC